MDAVVNPPKLRASELLLEHCFALGDDERRPSAAVRLEALLGRELSVRLVRALSSR